MGCPLELGITKAILSFPLAQPGKAMLLNLIKLLHTIVFLVMSAAILFLL